MTCSWEYAFLAGLGGFHILHPSVITSGGTNVILYYISGACSLSVHVALIEAGLPYQLVSVGLDKRTSEGEDFRAVNPKGYVPALRLDNGEVLTEALAILAYIAEHSGRLLPAGGMERWRALEATAFMTSEIHGGYKPLFRGASPEEKSTARQTLSRRFTTLSDQLGDRPFLVGDQMSIADPYLVIMLMWAGLHQVDVPERLRIYLARLKEHPSVARAIAEQGLPWWESN